VSSPQQIPNAVDVAQASELTGLSEKAVRRRLERGTLGSIKVGGKRLIPISELESRDLIRDDGGETDAAAPSAPPAPPPPERMPQPAQPGAGPRGPGADGESADRSSSPPVREEGSPGASEATVPPNGVEPVSAAPRSPEPVASAGSRLQASQGPASTSEPLSRVEPEALPSDPVVPVADPVPLPQSPVAQDFSAGGEPTVASAPAFADAGPAQQVAPMGANAPGYPPGQLVPGQAPPYVYPPERGGWYLWYQYRALRWLVVLLILALIGLLIWLLAFRGDGETATVQPGGGPVGVTEQELIELSQQLHQPIYWAGNMPGTRMELTETNNSYAYIRYLSGDAPVGDSSGNFLTVGTYPSPNAFRNLKAYASNSRAKTQRIQKGGVAVVIPGSPTSVYFAYPHEDVQVEVYDPEPQRAIDLVKSGVVRPVIASTSNLGTAGDVTVPTTTPAAPSELPTIPQG
jgi:excisionase family DNA binding protein